MCVPVCRAGGESRPEVLLRFAAAVTLREQEPKVVVSVRMGGISGERLREGDDGLVAALLGETQDAEILVELRELRAERRRGAEGAVRLLERANGSIGRNQVDVGLQQRGAGERRTLEHVDSFR